MRTVVERVPLFHFSCGPVVHGTRISSRTKFASFKVPFQVAVIASMYVCIINMLRAALGRRKNGKAEIRKNGKPELLKLTANHGIVVQKRLNRIDSTSKSLYCPSKSVKSLKSHRQHFKIIVFSLEIVRSHRQHFKISVQSLKIA